MLRLADGSLVGTLPAFDETITLQFLPRSSVLLGVAGPASPRLRNGTLRRWEATSRYRKPDRGWCLVGSWGNYLVDADTQCTTLADSASGKPWRLLPQLPGQANVPGRTLVFSPDGASLLIFRHARQDASWILGSPEETSGT